MQACFLVVMTVKIGRVMYKWMVEVIIGQVLVHIESKLVAQSQQMYESRVGSYNGK